MKQFYLYLLSALISACASSPGFDTRDIDPSLTPERVVHSLSANQGKTLLWGGLIININNLEQLTRIEVLAYPLNDAQLPLHNQSPMGRFLVDYQGFLEPSNYAPGRMITVRGTLIKLQQGKIGESNYLYPVLNSQQLYLWPQDAGQGKTRFHIGIGIGM
ncbi:MAG: Slp family lipoprotein [Gammaproteobacteria bacterium]|nr:Slp family lipoprotein [Gammaproteobacteria bacterium]